MAGNTCDDDRKLAERLRDRCKELNPSDRAKYVAKVGRTILDDRISERARLTGSKAELFDWETAMIEQAMELLAVLETEQWRQREAIKLFLHRREGEEFLRKVSDSWNMAK